MANKKIQKKKKIDAPFGSINTRMAYFYDASKKSYEERRN